MSEHKLLAICPSRGRPDTLIQMIHSFAATRESANLVVYLNEDDSKIEEYIREMKDFGYWHCPDPLEWLKVCTGPRKYIAEVYNMYAEALHVYDYYCTLNDDHFCVTPGWDKKLIDIVEEKGNGWGIAAAEDKLTDWKTCHHPSACAVSGKMIRALGYLVWPGIRHIGVDTYLMKISEAINRLYHAPEVVVEHRHWINGKRSMDENYKWVYGQEEQRYGENAIRTYLSHHFANDVKKLKDAIAKEKTN